MFQHMSQNFPAGKARLHLARKLNLEFYAQPSLRRVFDPSAVAVRKLGPAPPQGVKRRLRRRTVRKPPRSRFRIRTQTIEPDSFGIVNVLEGRENVRVGDAQVALKLFGREPGASLEQALIGPSREKNIRNQQLFGKRHAESIYVPGAIVAAISIVAGSSLRGAGKVAFAGVYLQLVPILFRRYVDLPVAPVSLELSRLVRHEIASADDLLQLGQASFEAANRPGNEGRAASQLRQCSQCMVAEFGAWIVLV